MPASDDLTPTFYLRFIKRPGFGQPPQTSRFILQQRWVRIGTPAWSDLTPENSEWRDVPLVEE